MTFIKSQIRKGYFFTKKKIYRGFNEQKFELSLQSLGITKGDLLYIVCSIDRIKHRTGHNIPVPTIIRTLRKVVGNSGTIIAPCYSINRSKIISGETKFNILRTPCQTGMFPELLRRRPEAVRSLHPIWSAVAIGPSAHGLCAEHHHSKFPFGEKSPFVKMMKMGGKYLGIGVGFEAFYAVHTIEDTVGEPLTTQIYEQSPRLLTVVDSNQQEVKVETLIRRKKITTGPDDPSGYLSLLGNKVNRSKIAGRGIPVFTMNMDEFFKKGISAYKEHNLHVWNTGRSVQTIKLSKLINICRNFL